MININDATRALAPKPEHFRLTEEWQKIRADEGPYLAVRSPHGIKSRVQLVVGAKPEDADCAWFTPTALRELSAFCAALADYLERGQG